MLKVKVSEYTGDHAVTWSDGEMILSIIRECVISKKKVQLDFSGIKLVNVTFFNGAIAPLTRYMTPEEIMEHLSIIELPHKSLDVLPLKVLEREWKFHNDPNFRESVNAAVAQSMRTGHDKQ